MSAQVPLTAPTLCWGRREEEKEGGREGGEGLKMGQACESTGKCAFILFPKKKKKMFPINNGGSALRE